MVPSDFHKHHVRVTENVKEACELAKVGFDRFTEINGVQIFRKRK